MSNENEKWKLRGVRRRVANAADLLLEGQSVRYHIHDHTTVGGRHSVSGTHDLDNGTLRVSLPEKGAHFPTMLHVLEAAVRTVLVANLASGKELPFPELIFDDHNSLGQKENVEHIRLPLNFNAPSSQKIIPDKNHVVFHKAARSKHINPEEVASLYYEWLKENSFSMFELWPAHTILQSIRDGRQPDDKEDVSFFHSFEGEKLEGLSLFNLGRIVPRKNLNQSVVELGLAEANE